MKMRPTDCNRLLQQDSYRLHVKSCQQGNGNKLVATWYKQPVLVILKQLVASLLPSLQPYSKSNQYENSAQSTSNTIFYFTN